MIDYVDSSEEYISIAEPRLPLPVITTETPCPGCGNNLTNRSCYYNKCQECSYVLSPSEKKQATTFLASIPYRELKRIFDAQTN